jgi:hypothetical protein
MKMWEHKWEWKSIFLKTSVKQKNILFYFKYSDKSQLSHDFCPILPRDQPVHVSWTETNREGRDDEHVTTKTSHN